MIDRERMTAVLQRIDLKRWPWRIEIRPTTDGYGQEVIHITEHVLERDSGEPIVLGGMPCGRPPKDATDDEIVFWIYEQVQRHVLHELAEAFHVDGVRMLDPHVVGEPR